MSLQREIDNLERQAADALERIKSLRRTVATLTAERVETIALLAEAQRGEAAVVAAGGVPASDLLAHYLAHGCGLNGPGGWRTDGQTSFCTHAHNGVGSLTGVWVRAEHGWLPGSDEDSRRHWGHA